MTAQTSVQLAGLTTNVPRQPGRQPGRGFFVFKRGLDLVVATLMLVVSAPIVGACALWIKFQDGGPVFYTQWRVGRNGWLFRIYKLRTMTLNAESCGQAQFAQKADPRVIRGCGWMRLSHIDELPQLWNILQGQMSLVGPRPERPEMVDAIGKQVPDFEQRLIGTPGLTGLAQVRHGYTNDTDGARQKLAYDMQYLHNRSVFSEIRLLLATVPKLWDQLAL